MIFYFSGTGNSFAVANTLAKGLEEQTIDISKAMHENHFDYTLADGEKLGFVFPVYAWAAPKMVVDFAKKLKVQNLSYCYAVCTCGATAGNTIDRFDHVLRKQGYRLDSAFSIVMPDNYTLFFDVEEPHKEQQKLKNAEDVTALVLRTVQEEKRNFFRVKKGKLGGLLTTVVNPGFSNFAMKTHLFHADSRCIGCGLCKKVCTSNCIVLDSHAKPCWTQKTCNMCMACINRCPVHAIEYGKKTATKGRYVHPIYRNQSQRTRYLEQESFL